MKIFIFFIFFTGFVQTVFSIEKPVFKTGTSSNSYFNINEKTGIYPSTLKDAVFMSISEDFNDIFTFKSKADFGYTNYNKYVTDIEDLTSLSFDNYISLYFNFFKYNQILLYTKPGYRYQNGVKYFTDANLIQYRLNMKIFSFVTYYSNRFALKENEMIYHKINFAFYWSIPQREYLKFKSSCSVVLQNPIYKTEKITTPLNSLNFTFEMAVDFNKVDFDEVFNTVEPENEEY